MKLIWINFFAVIIALTSIFIKGPSISFSTDQMTSIHGTPAWQIDSLRSPTEKLTEKNHIIAQNFIPIVIIADASDAAQSFSHYLPLYQLIRQKDYLLLI